MNALDHIKMIIAAVGGKMPRVKIPSRLNCGRKRFGPGNAKNYNDRVSANGWGHYSDRADENGWNAVATK